MDFSELMFVVKYKYRKGGADNGDNYHWDLTPTPDHRHPPVDKLSEAD
jgi:hypothetical protein